jgi:hypothetical protein
VEKGLVAEALCLGLLPTPTKETGNDGPLIASQRTILMRQISKQLGFRVGTSHRTLSFAKKEHKGGILSRPNISTGKINCLDRYIILY